MSRVRENKPHADRKFSNSAHDTFISCPMKYLHKYILQTPADSDADTDTLALRLGSAYHTVLENTLHQLKYFSMEIFDAACAEQELDIDDKHVVMAMVLSYYPLREASKLSIVACEVEIGNDLLLGYVDGVLTDVNGNWSILDLKSAASVKDILFARIASDKQLSLYAAFRNQIAEKCKLDVNKFAGVRYNVCVKPSIVTKPGENIIAYGKRVQAEMHEIFVPASLLNPEQALHDVMETRKLAHQLTPENACRNRNNCSMYFKSCEFWSKCHVGIYSECADKVTVMSIKSTRGIITSSIRDQTLPPLVDEGDLLL